MDSRLRGNDKKNKKKKSKNSKNSKNMGGTPTLHMGETPMLWKSS